MKKIENQNMKANLLQLKELANKKVTSAISKKIELIIESLHDRQDFARYHFYEYKDVMHTLNNDKLKIEQALQINNKNKKDAIAIKANITACMQNIHITHDILAYLIATVLNLDLNEREISFVKVKEKSSSFINLKKLLEDFSGHNDYKYLISYSNHTKHRFHIDSKLTFHFTQDKHYTAIFEKFSFKGNSYTEQAIESFLVREFNREQKLIIAIENELINILQMQDEDN